MNRKEYHTTLGALVCFCFASFFFFFVYTFGNHQKGKELTIELATEKARIVDLTEVVVEQQEEIDELKTLLF